MRSVVWLTALAVQMTTLFRVEWVQAKGTTETLHQWYVRLCTLHSWGLILRVDVPLEVGDEDVTRGYHELDRDGRFKPLVNGHIVRCCVPHKVAGNTGDREEHRPADPY